MKTHVTDEQIERLMVNAGEAGDIMGSAIAAKAIGHDYTSYAMTDNERFGVDAMSVEECRQRVDGWIADATQA